VTDAYLHSSDRKLVLQVSSDLNRHEGYREYAYADPLTPLYKKYAHLKKWGFVPARSFMQDNEDLDSGKPWTVGHGFTGGTTVDSVMSRITSQRKLEAKILEEDGKLRMVLPWYADSTFVTKTVLINMAFNLGIRGLLGFRNTLAFIKAGEYKRAASNMRASLWFRQVKGRAEELSKRMETQTINPVHKAPERI